MKNLYKKILLSFATIVLFTVSSEAVNINVSGTISSNTTWNADTVKVTSDITVNNGITLTITAGTYVQFQGGYKIDIKGCLLAQGSANDSIEFTALDTTTGWLGIRFDNTSTTNDTSKIKFCILSYGKGNSMGGAIYINLFSKVIISNSHIFKNKSTSAGGGICVWKGGAFLINNRIEKNSAQDGGGIYAYNGNISVIGNVILSNDGILLASWGNGGGIYLSGTTGTIKKNLIKDNYSKKNGAGLYLSNSNLDILNNKISNNMASGWGGAIHLSMSYGEFSNNLLSNNTADVGGAILFFQ